MATNGFPSSSGAKVLHSPRLNGQFSHSDVCSILRGGGRLSAAPSAINFVQFLFTFSSPWVSASVGPLQIDSFGRLIQSLIDRLIGAVPTTLWAQRFVSFPTVGTPQSVVGADNTKRALA